MAESGIKPGIVPVEYFYVDAKISAAQVAAYTRSSNARHDQVLIMVYILSFKRKTQT